MLRKLTLFTFLLFWVPLIAQSTLTPKPNIKLFRSEHPIALNTPIISKQSNIFIPIRDIAEHYDYSLTFSRKNNYYVLKTNNSTVYFTPNLKSFQINTIKKQFTQAPFKYKSRVYIPLSGLSMLNIKTEKKGSSYYLISKNSSKTLTNSLVSEKKTIPSKSTQSQKTLFKTNHNTEKVNASIHRAFPTLYILNKSYRRKDILTKFKNQRYINFKPVFLDNGYSIKHTNSGFILSKGTNQYDFNQRSQTVHKIVNKERIKVPITYQFYKHKNALLFSEKNFLHDLGLIPYNNFKQKKSILLTKIKSIEINKINNEYKLNLQSHHPLSVAGPFILKNPLRLYWDIPYSSFDSQTMIKKIQDSGIQSITIGKHPSKTRVVLTLGQSMTSSFTQSGVSSTITLKPGKLTQVAQSKRYKPKVKRYQTKINRSLRGKVIAIDPGHGGIDPGAIGIYNEKEKVYTLDISLRLKRELEKRGARVIIARSTDKSSSLGTRTRLANSYKADAFISVHVNSFVKSYAKGTETYYYKPMDKPLSREIQKGLVQTLKLQNNGIKKSNMYVLKYSTMPSVLIEPCFITNPTENYLIKQPSFRQKIADGVVIGLERYFKRYSKS